MSGRDALEQAQEEIFNLNLSVACLEEQLSDLAGGAAGVTMHGELLDARRLLQ